MNQDPPNLQFHPVTLDTWSDFELLFEGRGGPRFCWCMIYRNMNPSYGRADAGAKKEGMRGYVYGGKPVGILGYSNDEPAAWCSVAPIETHRNLRGRGYKPSDDEPRNVWSISCFFIKSGYRRQGLTKMLIGAAIEYARSNGADVVEAYPTVPGSPSYLFMGYVPTFEAMEFKEVGMVGARRHMMRLEV